MFTIDDKIISDHVWSVTTVQKRIHDIERRVQQQTRLANRGYCNELRLNEERAKDIRVIKNGMKLLVKVDANAYYGSVEWIGGVGSV